MSKKQKDSEAKFVPFKKSKKASAENESPTRKKSGGAEVKFVPFKKFKDAKFETEIETPEEYYRKKGTPTYELEKKFHNQDLLMMHDMEDLVKAKTLEKRHKEEMKGMNPKQRNDFLFDKYGMVSSKTIINNFHHDLIYYTTLMMDSIIPWYYEKPFKISKEAIEEHNKEAEMYRAKAREQAKKETDEMYKAEVLKKKRK